MRAKANAEELFNRAAGVVIYIAVFPKVSWTKTASLFFFPGAQQQALLT